ncbi:MAG: ribonuclease HII [Nevskia sp.]|jgi:ribonuclease HII|nr:ribonuclease HII [Nevskia sp.]MCK9385220.1 ribonuclease HII [Nevskia sp.]
MNAGADVRIAGIDEVGRGCLAGPVYAAAVILPPDHGLIGLRDSKRLSAAQRERLATQIRATGFDYAIGIATVAEIDAVNILQATLLAMQRAVAALRQAPTQCLIDGNRGPQLDYPTQTIIGGDDSVEAIMAASIIAKVARDAELSRLDQQYPGYGMAQHKGYGTPLHLAALQRLGPAPIHRLSFAPCAAAARNTA